MAKIHQIALALFVPICFASAQQTLTLTDGTQYQGRFLGGTPDLITFIDQDNVRRRVSVNQIQSLLFTAPYSYSQQAPGAQPDQPPPPPPPDAAANQPGYPPPSPAPYTAANQSGYPPPSPAPYTAANQSGYAPPPPAQPYQSASPADVPPPQPTSTYAALPAGTEIVVRTNESIRTNHGEVGRHFSATIDRDVRDANGNIVIPAGSEARMVVRDAGGGEVVLDLQSVFANGQRYFLNTTDIVAGHDREGLGSNRRTGEYVGGGAVLGTLLGAIAGGGRGAAIGAVAGAAAGAGTEVLTRGADIRVPAETRLRFRLDQPVSLYQ